MMGAYPILDRGLINCFKGVSGLITNIFEARYCGIVALILPEFN